MAISTNGTVLARVAGALYNTQMSNATYKEVAALDPSALVDVLYARDFSTQTDAAVATTLVTNLGLTSVTGLSNWIAAQLTAAGSHKGAKVVDLLNSFAQMTADTTYGAYATAFNTKVDAALALSQTTDNAGGTFAAAGTPVNATFALTTGVDTKTLGAGNDTINADVASLGALDVVDGGAGNDTLNFVDTGAVASGWGGATFSNIETVNVSAGGAVGALYTTATAAGTNTSAVAQKATFTVSAASASGQKFNVTIGGVVYESATNGATVTIAQAATTIKNVLTAHLGDAISISDDAAIATNGKFYVTSAVAGSPLPSLAVSVVAASGTGTATVATAAADANVIATGPIAVKQIETVTIADGGAAGVTGLDVGDLITVSISGVDYAVANSVATPTGAASDITSVINAVLGTGVATSAGGVVTITAPVAGTPLPAINVKVANASSVTDAWAQVSANQAANSAAVAATSASALSAPTGTTSYVVKATGLANVSGATTTAINATATAGAQTSGGSDVSVKAAGSVGVSAAKGAVTVTTTAISGNVINNPSTGNTATYGVGVYVSGGTTVSVTQKGAALNTTSTAVDTASTATGTSSGVYTNTIQIGVDPTAAKDVGSGNFAGAVKSPTTNNIYNAVGGLAGDATGNVTTTASTAYTTATGKKAVAYAGATQKAFVNGADTVSLTGVNTGTVTDVNTTIVQTATTDTVGVAAGTSKLTAVNLTGIKGTTTIKSDAITTVKVVDSTGSGAVSVTNSGTDGVNTGAFNLTVGNSTVSVTNATTKAVNIASAASAYETLDGTAPVTNANALTLVAGEATSLNFTNANAITLTNGGLAKVAAVTASGAGDLALGSVASGWTKLTSVDASTASGKVSITLGSTPSAATVNGFNLKTGSGADTVTLNGANTGSVSVTGGGLATTTIDMGAGNDSLAKSGSGAVISGATIDAGAGTDTVAATLVNAGNAAIFKNFERIAVVGGADGGSFDASLLTNSTITGVVLNGALAATTTNTFAVSNIAGTTANFDVVASTGSTVTGTLATATGTADSALVTFASSNTGSSDATVTAAGVRTTALESLSIVSGGTIVNETNFTPVTVNNVLTAFEDTGNSVASVAISGDKALNIGDISVSRDGTTKAITAVTFTADFIAQQTATLTSTITSSTKIAAALKTVDGSAATGNLAIYAGVSNSITDGTNTSTTGLTYDALVVKGGSGSDALRNDGKSGVTEGGAGGDWIVVGGTLGSANGGDGDDTLTASATKVTLTGGAGKDTFIVSTAIAGGAGSTASTANTDPYLNTITDFAKGDKLVLGSTVSDLVNGTTAIATATTLAGALDAALKIATDVVQNDSVWFVYGGNTYIALEDGTDGLTNGDVVVKLAGVYDLTAAVSLASNVITGV
jgi:hypothetical protein